MATQIPRTANTKGSDSGQVTVQNTSTLICNATEFVGNPGTNTLPIRKQLIITNTGAKAVFIKIGSAPTATSDYDFMLVPASGTVDTSDYVAPGVFYADVSVPQDNIYGITASSTTTVNVYVGV